MTLSGIDPAASLELSEAYHKAAQALLAYQLRLSPLVKQAQQQLALARQAGAAANQGALASTDALKKLSQLHRMIVADSEELIRRRELFRLADSALLRQFQTSQLNSLELNIWELPLPAQRSFKALSQLLVRHDQLGNLELTQVLRGLLVRSLRSPATAFRALRNLGADSFATLANRIMGELEQGLHVPAKRAEALGLLQALAMLVGKASQAPTGIPADIRSYLLPDKAGWDQRHQVRHLGMLLALGRFHAPFAAQAASFLIDKANRDVVIAASSDHPLKHQARAGPRAGHQPYQAMLNPLEQALGQVKTSPEPALAMLNHIVSSWGSADIDTYAYHGLAPDLAMAELLDTVVAEAASNAEFRDRSWPTLLRLFEWIPNHDQVWKSNSPVWSSLAQMVGLHWPQLRQVASDVTQPVLVRVAQDPEAMSLLSLSVGAFTLGHLSEAIEVELKPGLDDSVRDRHISVHVDAVADAYHHVFVAAAGAGRQPQKKAMSLLAGALNFVDRKLMRTLLVGSITPPQRAIATVAAMGVRKFRDSVTQQVRQAAPEADVSPQSVFAQQIGNRDKAAPGGAAPQPTWFELELANKLLEHQPQLLVSLSEGSSGSADASRWLRDGKIIASQTPAFADWFAAVTNADPPTEFSLVFVHLQREFANDLLLDATSVALDSVSQQASQALEVSQQTQREWQEWSRQWRQQQGQQP